MVFFRVLARLGVVVAVLVVVLAAALSGDNLTGDQERRVVPTTPTISFNLDQTGRATNPLLELKVQAGTSQANVVVRVPTKDASSPFLGKNVKLAMVDAAGNVIATTGNNIGTITMQSDGTASAKIFADLAPNTTYALLLDERRTGATITRQS